MFSYYLKLGLLSIRNNPVLSALMVAAIAIGIGACMTMVTIHYVMSGDPIPQKSGELFYVQLDNWAPDAPADPPNEPPDQVTYLDAAALLAAGKARRQIASYQAGRIIQPPGDDARPFEVAVRSTSSDFFAMFDVPFLYGSGWDASSDREQEQVVVLSRAANERLYGGENSVGYRLTMNDDTYRVAGVLDEWLPVPKFYDTTTGAFNDPEDVYMPFSVSIAKELSGQGNTNCWKPVPNGGWQSFLNSECVWMQFWVELHGASEQRDYRTFLDAYVESQKALGRFPRRLNNRISDVMAFLESEQVVDNSVRILLVLAVLFLIVCLLNTIGLLLAKVMRRSGDISLRRALGARRGAIFAQYVVEAGLIGATGGVVGLLLTWLGLIGVRGLYRDYDFIDKLVQLDWVMVLTAIGLAILSALGAALYPTWRACRIHPASQLKTL